MEIREVWMLIWLSLVVYGFFCILETTSYNRYYGGQMMGEDEWFFPWAHLLAQIGCSNNHNIGYITLALQNK